MVADFGTARQEIHNAFNAAWQSGAAAVNGGVVPKIKFEGIPFTDQNDPPRDAQWCRISIRHSSASQSAMGSTGRFEKIGTVTVQIFSTLELDDPPTRCEVLAQIAKDAFEAKKTSSQVWFRNVTINEIGTDDAWYNVNVIADFEYDELTSS